MPRLAVAPLVLAACVAVLGGVLAASWLTPRPPEPAPSRFAVPPPAVPAAPREVALDFDPWSPVAAEASPPLGNTPRFDVVRVDPEGRLVLGGRAVPGDRVQVAIGGRPQGPVEADAEGAWVMLDGRAPGQGRIVLTVTAEDGNGRRHPGDQRVTVVTAGGGEAVVYREDGPGLPARLLQGPQGLVGPAGLSLDAVNYAMSGAMELAGIALPGAAVRVLRDGRVLAHGRADAYGGWTVLLPADLPAGAHRLRLAQFPEDGALEGTLDVDLERTPLPPPASGLSAPVSWIVVQPGGSAFVFARRLLRDDRPRLYLFEANGLEPAAQTLLIPGQILALPDATAPDVRVSARD
ncbi:hypothetical protein [Marinivivus vitaminiproducens]|uniref:hypothetical protein n=1 Tax=Marinivivus vitaminiproducens TaxID=3035935 RepID=UPI0027AB5FFB|nr:hypothetical protein P4R82_15580 [Geminicoccaceae bacterium SCSIO 64248]